MFLIQLLNQHIKRHFLPCTNPSRNKHRPKHAPHTHCSVYVCYGHTNAKNRRTHPQRIDRSGKRRDYSVRLRTDVAARGGSHFLEGSKCFTFDPVHRCWQAATVPGLLMGFLHVLQCLGCHQQRTTGGEDNKGVSVRLCVCVCASICLFKPESLL